MSKEGVAAALGVAFSVGLTVTPGLQSWWFAVPAWVATAYLGWRWYFHRDEPATAPFEGRFFKPRHGPIDSPTTPTDTDAITPAVAVASPLATHITRSTLVTTRKTAMLNLRDRPVSSDDELSDLKDDTEIWKDGIRPILSKIGRPEDAAYFDAPMTHRCKASGGYNDEHNQLLAELDEYLERLKRIIKRMAGP